MIHGASPLRYTAIHGAVAALYDAVCSRDTEGIVAKLANGVYAHEPTSWCKIKNAAYPQAEGRYDFFDQPRAARAQRGS